MSGFSPASTAIRRALLAGKRRPRVPGGSPTSRIADGYEFAELRAYVPGDDVRRIDWAATARCGDLQTRVMLEDVSLTFAGLLDDTPSMKVGRNRPLLEAGREALHAWYACATSDDRCLRVAGETLLPSGAKRGPVSAAIALHAAVTFDLGRSLAVASTALRPGSALLAIGDWYDLDETPQTDATLALLSRRCDCTMLFARDPWFGGLPLGGFVRMRGVEGGNVRAYIGAAERARYERAVRARERTMLARFETAGWRSGILDERDGAASLAAAFGV
ncbi:MAG: DUF58 domain-containing protein [Candidatus Tyrphobacter sp.]